MNGCALALVLALVSQASPADSAGVQVHAEALPDSLTIGDRFTLNVSVSGAATGRVVFPILPDTGDVTALTPPRVIEGPGEGVQSAVYEMAAWRVGELEIPPAYITAERDGVELEIPLPGVKVQVASVLPADADADTLAWQPPWDVVGANWSLAEKLAAAALALAVLLATVFFVRRRRAASQPFPRFPRRSPRERALDALGDLAASGLLDVGELKAFYSELSRIIREFLADSERLWGSDLTTAELVSTIANDGVTDSDLRTMAQLLVEADLVKFSRQRPPADGPAATLATARQWIEGFARVTVDEEAADEEVPVVEQGVEPQSTPPIGDDGESERATS